MPAPPSFSPPPSCLRPLVTPALPPSSLHPLRHPRTPPSSLHSSVIPAPFRHPRTPSVIPAPPPSSPHPSVIPAPPPSFLRRQESMRPPDARSRPRPSTAHRSTRRRGHPIGVSQRWSAFERRSPTRYPSERMDSCLAVMPASPSFLRRQESMRPPDARSRPRPSTAHRSTRRRGHPIGVSQRWSAVERRSPTRYPSERVDSCLRGGDAGGAGMTEGVGMMKGASESAGRRTQHS